MPRLLRAAALVLISWFFTGCGVHDDQTGSPAQTTGGTPEILLFNGAGSSPNDVKAFETILKDQTLGLPKKAAGHPKVLKTAKTQSLSGSGVAQAAAAKARISADKTCSQRPD